MIYFFNAYSLNKKNFILKHVDGKVSRKSFKITHFQNIMERQSLLHYMKISSSPRNINRLRFRKTNYGEKADFFS